MATSSEFVRLATSAARTLTEAAFDAGRDAVVVVDTRLKHFPLVLANATARRSILGAADPGSLVDTSLYSLLGAATDSTIEAAVGSEAKGLSSVERLLPWRLPRGLTDVTTELKLLAPAAAGRRLLMLTFVEPSPEPKLLSAIEHLPLDLLILDRELKVTYANASAARTAGVEPSGILNRAAATLVPMSALPRDAFARVLDGNLYESEALEVQAAGGAPRRFRIDLQPLKEGAEIVGIVVLSAELTERRALGRAVGNSERRFLALTEHARDIITIAGRDGELHYVSGGVLNSLGYTADERHCNSIFEHIHPEDVPELRANYRNLVAGELQSYASQYRIRHKDGSYRWLESNYVPALDNPLINGVVINSRDVTDRKQAEARLAQREEVFRLAADAVDGVVFEWDLIRGHVDRSRGVLEVLGLDPATLPPSMDAWYERIHPSDFAGYRNQVSQALIAGRGWTATYRMLDGHGRYRSLLERALIQRNAFGDPVRAIGCCVDVSEIKRLTDLLAQTQRTAKMGGWEYSLITQELSWTPEMYRIYGQDSGEFTLSWESMLARFVPESRRRFDDSCREAVAGSGELDLELEILTLGGSRLWVRMIGHLERAGGKALRAYGSVQDIQAQKLSQIALENSTDWLKLSMNMAHMHAWRWNKASDAMEFAIVEGGQRDQLPTLLPGMQQVFARLHPDDLPRVLDGHKSAIETGAELRYEFRLKSLDGEYRAYETVARPSFDPEHRASGLVGVTQDITARRDADERVRRSEEILRTTTANTADTLLLLDTDLCIRFINRAVGESTIEDIIGRHVSVVIPEAARARVIGKLRHLLRFGQPATYEFETANGSQDLQYFESCAVLVRDGSTGTGLSITVRNITERKRLEQEILDVASRERHSIGRDLHDGLGQELTGIALMLRGLTRRIEKESPAAAVESVNEIVALVNQSIESARSLARGLLPVRTDTGGLPLALRTLAARSRDAYGLDVHFRSEVWPTLTLSEANASHLYRITQEALTNAARHGHAAHVDILLLVTKNTFLLRITDDGVGISESADAAPGMGLRIMKYRADMIGAKFEIARNEPCGTVVRVTGEQPPVTSALESAHAS